MIFDKRYWTSVLQRIVYVVFLLICTVISFKLAIFYMPFLIAFIIALIIEPLIKMMMEKLKLSRRISAIIIFAFVALIILGSLTYAIITTFSEASNLLRGLNEYFDKAGQLFNDLSNSFDFNKIHLSNEIKIVIRNSTDSILSTASNWLADFLNGIVNAVTSLPKIAIYFAITVLALYFISVDRIYILDQMEHHLPESWMKKLGQHFRELVQTLGNYLKAQAILIIVSFVISLIGLYILKIIGFNIAYPLLMAIFIAFVDALPILGSGTVMIPWAIICAINGDINLGIAIIVLLIIMSIARQVLEPKLVSKNIGIHPIFTLIAMYTGFKIIGIIGLLIGPIVLIIFKNIFSNLIDKGVFKTIFDRK